LDRSRNYRINHTEIQDFLRDNYINVLSSEAKLLIAAYDDDKDGDLDFKEFEKLILPATNNALKLRTYDRREEFVGYREKLHYRIEDSLAKLFKSEIDKLKELELEKELVTRRYDFSRYDAFKVIDKYRLNSLLREDLRSFLNINGVYATALDADNLMRRIDLDNDGRITYSEFCDFLEQGRNANSNNCNNNNLNNNNYNSYKASATPEKNN
jgi:Ca2+-binding EF-hand superfamily protein